MYETSAQTRARGYDAVAPGDIPRFVSYTSPVSIATANGGVVKATTLPLNLIALIVGFLDDIADIARVTRTSRLLYYMTLPQLYAKVGLHSYPEVRYVNGKPEGFGSGSPFMMALNGLVTNPHAALVQHFRVWGQWNEVGAEDFAKGRVPDDSMMLNIVLRAAVDRMVKLQSFSWELDCKPLKTLYQGLGAHNTLTSLTIKFPQSRLPRPSVMIPPMVNLRAFKALDIDPLCYPDDFSVMLLHSKKIEDLRIHFSPRMRREAESSLNLNTYFGRCMTAGHRIPLKHFGMQNYYGPGNQDLASVVDHERCISMCGLDMFGGLAGNLNTKFYDDTWKAISPDWKTNVNVTRCNEPAEQHVKMMSNCTGHEKFYMVGSGKREQTGTSPGSWTPTALATPVTSPPASEILQLGKQYLDVLGHHHGSTLKHLLLSDQWVLSEDDVKDLVRQCPRLEQLGLAIEGANLSHLRLILPNLPNLHSLRILGDEVANQLCPLLETPQGRTESGRFLEGLRVPRFRYLGLGDRVFKAGHSVQDETIYWRRDLHEVTPDTVDHIEIWRLDALDISLDPVAPFSP